MRKVVWIGAVCLVAVAAFVAGFGYGRWYGPRGKAEVSKQDVKPKGYHCPMHPNFRSDKPGECRIALTGGRPGSSIGSPNGHGRRQR